MIIKPIVHTSANKRTWTKHKMRKMRPIGGGEGGGGGVWSLSLTHTCMHTKRRCLQDWKEITLFCASLTWATLFCCFISLLKASLFVFFSIRLSWNKHTINFLARSVEDGHPLAYLKDKWDIVMHELSPQNVPVCNQMIKNLCGLVHVKIRLTWLERISQLWSAYSNMWICFFLPAVCCRMPSAALFTL